MWQGNLMTLYLLLFHFKSFTKIVGSFSNSKQFKMTELVSKDYKEHVKTLLKLPKDYPRILTESDIPVVNCVSYHSLGIAVSSVQDSYNYYHNLGFEAIDADLLKNVINGVPSKGQEIVIIKNKRGLELHLIQADKPLEDNQNLLMDFQTTKPPGHTHASWSVCSVPGVKNFLSEANIPLSGTRSTLAVFCRDPDRTTLEFERNDGGDDAPVVFTSDMIGYKNTLDHIGTRIRAPLDRHVEFYAKNLGFLHLVNKYEANPEPLKNMPPWITRTIHGCDINFIINCNTPIPDSGENTENILFAGGILRPGIVYATYEINEDISSSLNALRANGVDAILDHNLKSSFWGEFPVSAVRLFTEPTILIRDLNGNIIRLISSTNL